MPSPLHPSQALFAGERPFPRLPACDHYAGNEKFLLKALELQQRLGPLFDITCDCEDGAAAGREAEHAAMVVSVLTSPANRYRRCGVRIHSFDHPAWRQEVDAVLQGAGEIVGYFTLPKVTGAGDTVAMAEYIRARAAHYGVQRQIPLHVLIETHGALRDAFAIAAVPGVEVLAFGLLDFISDHYGAIPGTAMRSPGQFQHALLVRAKAEIAAAALAHGCVAAHNITLDLKNTQQVFDDAHRARTEFGFLRMWSIHPAQIEPIVDAMRPELSEISDAGEILLQAQARDWAPIQFRGHLHDRASYRYFWRVLQQAHVTGAELPAAVRSAFF